LGARGVLEQHKKKQKKPTRDKKKKIENKKNTHTKMVESNHKKNTKSF